MKNKEQIDAAAVEGVESAIGRLAEQSMDGLPDLLRAFSEATTLADTYWEMLHLYTHKNDTFVEAFAEQVRKTHEKLIRLKEANGKVEIQIREHLMPH